MAKHRKKARARHSNAGRPRHYKKVTHRKRHRGNPGALGSPMDWFVGGAGVIAGGVLSRVLPQAVLSDSNQGPVGYLANAITALGLGWLSHMFFPRQRMLTITVIAGGFGSLLQRIIADKTPYGAALSMTGLGDWGLGLYQKSNFNNPQRIVAPRGPNSSMFTWGDGSQMPVASFAAAGNDSNLPC